MAAEVGGLFARCDVREPADSEAAVAAAVSAFGRLDVAFLNAGASTTSVELGGRHGTSPRTGGRSRSTSMGSSSA